MKKIFTLCTLFLLGLHAAFAQWNAVNSTSWFDLHNMQMLSATNGFIAGNQGLYATTDGGNTWGIMHYTQSDSLFYQQILRYGVHFNGNNGTVVGYSSNNSRPIIIRTTNGGSTWTTSYTGTATGRFYDVVFANANVGVAIGTSGLMMRTLNGGSSWSSSASGVTTDLNDIDFDPQNDSIGLIVTQNKILRTVTRGTWWNTINFTNEYFTSVHFAAHNIAYALSQNSIYKTIDGGATWNKLETNLTNGYSLFFTSADTGYACGSTIYKTTNGGLLWEDQAGSFNGSFIHFYDSESGFYGGLEGELYKTANAGGNQWMPEPDIILSNTPYCTDSIYTFRTGYSPNYTYQWFLNGQPISTHAADSAIMLGTYSSDTISVIATNSNGSDTAYKTFNTVGPLPFNLYMRTNRDTICKNQTVTIYLDSTKSSINYQLNIGGVNYGSSVSGNGGTLSIVTPNLGISTTLKIFASRNTWCGAYRDTIEYPINVNNPYITPIAAVTSALCYRDTAKIAIINSEPGVNYWLYNGSNYGTPAIGNGDTTYINIPGLSQNYTFSIRAVSGMGCITNFPAQVSFTVREMSLDFYAPYSAIVGEQIQLQNLSNGDNYVWTFNPAAPLLIDSTFLPSTPIIYNSSGEKTIKLKGTTVEGCIASLERRIRVYELADTNASAQVCQLDTLPLLGNTSNVLAYHVDRFGNQYVAGYTYWPYHGWGYSGSYHYFLQKFDVNGNNVWSKESTPWLLEIVHRYKFSGGYVSGISSDPDGNIYICGTYGATQFLLDTISVYNSTTALNYYAAKLDTAGHLVWITHSGNTTGNEIRYASDILYIDSNHVMLSSSLGNELYLPNDSLAYNLPSEGHYIIQLDNNGWYQNSFKYSDNAQPWGLNVEMYNPSNTTYNLVWITGVSPKLHLRKDGKLTAVGHFTGALNFGNGTVNANGVGVSGFVATLNLTSGWESHFLTYHSNIHHDPNGARIRDVQPVYTFDSEDNLYISKRVTNDSPGTYSIFTVNGPAFNDTVSSNVLMRFRANGQLSYATKIDAAYVNALVISNNDTKIALLGDYNTIAGFTSISGSKVGRRSLGGQDAYIAAYDSAGNFQWIDNLGSIGTESLSFASKACAGITYAIGSSTSSATIQQTSLNSTQYRHYFLKYDLDSNNCQQPQVCPKYIENYDTIYNSVSLIGSFFHDSTLVIKDSITLYGLVESLDTIHTYDTLITSVELLDLDTLYYQNTTTTYDTQQAIYYTTLTDSIVYVSMSESHVNSLFIDTMRIIRTLLQTGISEAHEKYAMSLYPNPANKQITVVADKEIGTIEMYNAQGALLHTTNTNKNAYTLNIADVPRGIYYVAVKGNGYATRKKFVKL